ncbi:hypothetical protein HZC09_04615 [Candidatus Micrarchaeota archaeon]|nr:hypothetical protein [Candidatus Micrarchaeota archaeon]
MFGKKAQTTARWREKGRGFGAGAREKSRGLTVLAVLFGGGGREKGRGERAALLVADEREKGLGFRAQAAFAAGGRERGRGGLSARGKTEHGCLPGLRAQAALFDGITLMLLASISAGLIFTFISSYGIQEEKVLRSAYVLNYMQSSMKAFYYLDAVTLKGVSNKEKNSLGRDYYLDIYSDLIDSATGCPALKDYVGSFTVTDLLKRDLAEKVPMLDDHFETAEVVGITAVRCAMKEIIKPFAYSGYYYGFDVISGTDAVVIPDQKKTVTNYRPFLENLENPLETPKQGVCEKAQSVSGDALSVASPFMLVYINPDEGTRRPIKYEVRLCIWRPSDKPIVG